MVLGIFNRKAADPVAGANPPEANVPTELSSSETTEAAPLVAANTASLHNPVPSPKNPGMAEGFSYKKFSSEDEIMQAPHIQRILKRFAVGKNSANVALLDRYQNKLVIISDGPTAYKQLFNNSWLYLLFGWMGRIFGRPNRNCVGAWDKEGMKFSKSKSDPKAKILEPLSHIRRALKRNEYKTVTMFYLNQKTNEFEKYPSAVALIDHYQPVVEDVTQGADKQQAEIAKRLKEQGTFKGWYCTDQYLVNPDTHLELRDITHNVCEAFYQGHGYDGLTVHYKVHDADNMVSENLSYDSVPWKHLYERNDETWTSSDDAHPMSKITVVRPKSARTNPLPKELAYLHAWSQLARGKSYSANQKNASLVVDAEKVNSRRLGEFNQALAA